MEEISKLLDDIIEKSKDGNWEFKSIWEFSIWKLKFIFIVSTSVNNVWPVLLLRLDYDVLQNGLGAVLSHIFPIKTEKRIAYVTRTLNKNKQNHSEIDKEGASTIFDLNEINQYLLGDRFIIISDNKAIKKYLIQKQN